MKRSAMIHLGLVFGVCAVSSAHAHHSHPYFYDSCERITIEGRVESVQWKDPHTWIVLKRDDGAAYTVDWNGLSSLTTSGNIGTAKAALEIGTRIAVTGNPIRSLGEIRKFFPDHKYEVNPNTVDPVLIRRVDGSWSWGRRPSDRMATAILPPCAD